MKNASNFNHPSTAISVLIVFFSLTLFIPLYFPNVLAQDTLTDADGWFNKGTDLFELGDYNGAIAQFDKALVVDPLYEDALYNKAIALENLGNFAEAIKYYDKVLAVNPGNTDATAAKNNTTAALSSSE